MSNTHRSAIKLAFADDQTLIRTAVINALKSEGIYDIVLEAENGTRLLEQLSNAVLLPDICILDVNPECTNGYHTVKTLKAKWPEIKILVLTSTCTDYVVVELLQMGINGYMLKNCTLAELTAAIKAVYEHGFCHSNITITQTHKAMNGSFGKMPVINEREKQFLMLCCNDCHYKEIAQIMNVSPRTVDGYRDRLFEKLQSKSRIGLAMYALRIGLVNL